MSFLTRFIQWILRQLGMVLLIAGAIVGGYAWWICQHDPPDFERHQAEWLAGLNVDRKQRVDQIAALRLKETADSAEISTQEARALQAAKIITQLHDLESTWDRLIGNPAQQKANAEQIAHLDDVKTKAQGRVAALRTEIPRLGWERDRLEGEIAKIDEQLHFATTYPSQAAHYLHQSWLRTKWWAIAAVVLYFVVPGFLKLRRFWAKVPV